MTDAGSIVRLRSATASSSPTSTSAALEVLVDVSTGAPAIVHLGDALGEIDLAEFASAIERPVVHGSFDSVAPISVVPEHGAGFLGRPALLGRRGGGRDWSPRFEPRSADVEGSTLVTVAVDEVANLELRTTIAVDHVVRVSASVTNLGERRWSLDSLTTTVPIPEHLDELLTFEGRWVREFQIVREPWRRGVRSIENRSGRTSHEHPPAIYVGSTGFGEWSGDVLGAHLAWSGNHQLHVERLADGRRYVQAGELLHPGEVVLEPGESYSTPELLVTWSSGGLTPASWGFHRAARALPAHPVTSRPVLVNTWEAVYFDHDLTTLRELAEVAADVGIERFVLDDGWFGSRRDDTKGLGDWWVSDEAHPDGLGPLIEAVTGHGMEFGIWVEPEMVNVDSELYRAHPDWVLHADGYEPVLGRHQLVLDLGNPAAFDHVHGLLHALLRDHDIAYVKWDMNRGHLQATGADGAAGARTQTLAAYRLIDELRAAHPGVEFESCASGGGRIDHEILRRVERVWTSDCNDALERQRIQQGASLLIPPEVMGAHIGPPTAHTTGRRHRLSFRAITAMFGHLGVEWDLTSLRDHERSALREVVALHRRHRVLLHSGDVVRFDTDDSCIAHGVYSIERDEALVSFAQMSTAASLVPAPLRLPDLDADARYRLVHVPVAEAAAGPAKTSPAWWDDGVTLTGRQLAVHGVQLPVLFPETAVLLHLVRVD